MRGYKANNNLISIIQILLILIIICSTIQSKESINYSVSNSTVSYLNNNVTIDQYQTNISGGTVKFINSSDKVRTKKK